MGRMGSGRRSYSANPNEYKLLEEVGYGASATVYRSIYLPNNDVVAVKCLDLDRCNSNLTSLAVNAKAEGCSVFIFIGGGASSKAVQAGECFLMADMGRNGRAFLFSHPMNIAVGPKEERRLTTGLHTVADVYCYKCREVLGWKYVRAYEQTQKYKEGKVILE